MATVIDALLITLGIDASGLKKGTQVTKDEVKKVKDELKKVKDETAATAKDMEARGEQAAQFFSRIRKEAIFLFAVLTAGRGIKDFVKDITAGDAALGYLATNLGMSTSNLSAWQGAAERAGGSASATGGSLYGLSQQFQQFAMTGQSSVVPYFRALGIAFTDAQGQMRPMDELLLDLADKFSKMTPAKAQAMGAGLGLDQGTIQLLMKGRAAVTQLTAEQRRLGVATDEDAKRAQELDNKLKDLRQGITGVARVILNSVTPALVKFMEHLKELIEANGEKWARTIGDALLDFVHILEQIDWQSVKDGFSTFATGASSAAEAVGGWTRAIEILFALWLGSKFLKVLANVTMLARAGSAGAAGGAGLVSRLSRFFLPLAALGFVGGGTGEEGLSQESKDRNKKAREASIRNGIPMAEMSDAEKAEANKNRLEKRAKEDAASPPSGVTKFFRRMFGDDEKTEAPTQSTNDAGYKPVLDLIGKTEGTDKGRGYNETLGYGAYTGGKQDLTGKSLKEIMELQTQMLAHPDNKMNSSAVGRYQITRSTLTDLMKKEGLSGNEKFDAAMQDRLAISLIKSRAKGTAEQVQNGLSTIWASIPRADTGEGNYAGQRRTPVGSDTVQTAIRQMGNPAVASNAAPSWYNQLPRSPAGGGTAYDRNTVQHNDNSQQANINGPINIHTQAKDADGIARDMHGSLRKQAFMDHANTGLA